MDFNKDYKKILSDAAYKLFGSKAYNLEEVEYSGSGFYVLFINTTPFYAGEALNIQNRLSNHTRDWNNGKFDKRINKKGLDHLLTQTDRQLFVKYLITTSGRKELEDAFAASFDLINVKGKNNPHFRIGKPEFNGSFDQLPSFEEIQRYYSHKLESNEFLPLMDVKPPSLPGIYQVQLEGKLIYTGETRNLSKRIYSHKKTTRQSAFRRNIGRDIFNFELCKGSDGKKMYFSPIQDQKIDDYLAKCQYRFLPMNWARAEFEEYLIKEGSPLLNRLGNH